MPEPILCLSRRDVEQVLTFEAVLPMVAAVFSQQAAGQVTTFPAVRVGLEKQQGVFGIKSGFIAGTETLGLKAGGYWGQRVAAGQPGHYSTIVLFDPNDGRPVALLDGNLITELRTAAAGALAAQHLARTDIEQLTVGLIGAGVQGRAQILGLTRVLKVAQVLCFDLNLAAAGRLADELSAAGVTAHSAPTAEAAVRDAQVLVTTTPSRQAYVRDSWLQPGLHINAMGSDTRGKQELEVAILRRAKVVVDDPQQARTLGESQHLTAEEADQHPPYAQLGELTAGRKPGRANSTEITVFDGTGVAFQDLATAHFAVQVARARGLGQLVQL
jgi:ornithine cyclodeaminase/alanine dehydrogenase-like protein (mu-crystallin family)